jgi:hypothetical protein
MLESLSILLDAPELPEHREKHTMELDFSLSPIFGLPGSGARKERLTRSKL